MASIVLLANGDLSFYVAGVRDSRVFTSKRDAQWATSSEAELRNDAKKPKQDKYTLCDALDKYAEEVSPKKRGERWEDSETPD